MQIAAGSPEALFLTGCGIVNITGSIFCKVPKYMSDFAHEIQTTIDDLLHQVYECIFPGSWNLTPTKCVGITGNIHSAKLHREDVEQNHR